MNYWPHGLAVLVGVGLTLQVGINAIAGGRLGSPLLGAVMNFAVGLVALVAVAVVVAPRPQSSSFASLPAWAWTGGLLGAAYVASTTILGPRLGAATLERERDGETERDVRRDDQAVPERQLEHGYEPLGPTP